MNRPFQKKQQWADHYTQKAKKDRYPARSVYKLQEIQTKQCIIRKGGQVLDLGCAPGSWLLFAAEVTGPSGQVVGIDLNPVKIALPGHVVTYTGDIFLIEDDFPELTKKRFHTVLSDMAPSTSGHKETDAARSFELSRAALSVARNVLLPRGNFVCKIFQGADFKEFTDSVKSSFKQLKIFKPQSSRKGSREIYIIGSGLIESE